MHPQYILRRLPYTKPFLFVDALHQIDENGVTGTFKFLKTMDFYKGHFRNNPVTPGAILTECCAQIGVVCLGIFLLGNDENLRQGSNEVVPEKLQIAMSNSEMEFLLPVFPNEKVTVTSKKIYFRFQKLKCAVKMHNQEGKLVCRGEIAGMIQVDNNG